MKILVTAGPTQEPIDPVRFISNRSSGKMGYAVAAVARSRGHAVRLISGPVNLVEPAGIPTVQVCTAAEMLAAVKSGLAWCDALIMVAAVADWRPVQCAVDKLKKGAMRPVLELEPTVDILADIRELKGDRIFVGFAAETRDRVKEARRKLDAKGLDLVVANDVTQPGAAFGGDTNIVTLVARDGTCRELPVMSKSTVGAVLVEWIEKQRSSMA